MFETIDLFVLLPRIQSLRRLKLDCTRMLIAVMEELQDTMEDYMYEVNHEILLPSTNVYLMKVVLIIQEDVTFKEMKRTY